MFAGFFLCFENAFLKANSTHGSKCNHSSVNRKIYLIFHGCIAFVYYLRRTRTYCAPAFYVAAGKDTNAIPCTEFFAPDRLDFTHGKYICIDGLYHSYLLIPSIGYKSRVSAGWLSLLVNAGDGIDIDLFLSKQPKERMVQKLGQQLRITTDGQKMQAICRIKTRYSDIASCPIIDSEICSMAKTLKEAMG